MHLASLDTGAASLTFDRIDYRIIVGGGHRFLDPEFRYSPQNPAAAAAAVADVINTLRHVADRMDKADLFGFIQDRQGFFLGDKRRLGSASRLAAGIEDQFHMKWEG